jgi:hypothetical protein
MQSGGIFSWCSVANDKLPSNGNAMIARQKGFKVFMDDQCSSGSLAHKQEGLGMMGIPAPGLS